MRIDRRATCAVLAALALGGCTASAVSGSPVPVWTSPRGSTLAPQPSAPKQQYYLSLGDSYPAGYQPDPPRTTRIGFPYQVVTDSRAKGYDYTLVNLACSGATTDSILHTSGCDARLRGPGAPDYGALTQADAAVRFLQQHQGQVGLITISIGGNDFLRCGIQPNTAACLTNAVQTIGTNLGILLARLRAAGGSSTRIVGTTYPDIFLGNLASAGAALRSLAKLSVTAFRSLLNPQLARVYAAAGATFIDVTRATGGYRSLTRLTNFPPYGRIPVPVADVCRYTWYCKLQDVHPTPAGHALIANLVVATLPSH